MAEDITKIEAKSEAEDDWCKRMNEKWDITLFPKAKSWYQVSLRCSACASACVLTSSPGRKHSRQESRATKLGRRHGRVYRLAVQELGQQLPGLEHSEGTIACRRDLDVIRALALGVQVIAVKDSILNVLTKHFASPTVFLANVIVTVYPVKRSEPSAIKR